MNLNARTWTDWVPVDRAFGEWFIDTVTWDRQRVGDDDERVLTVNLENSSGELKLTFLPSVTRIWSEHSVANEPGYRSYQRHSLYVVPDSAWAVDYKENPHYLLRGASELPLLTHYRIITLGEVVDVLACTPPTAELKLKADIPS